MNPAPNSSKHSSVRRWQRRWWLIGLAAMSGWTGCNSKPAQQPQNAGLVDRVLTSARARLATSWAVVGQAGPDVKPNAEGQKPLRRDQTRAPLPQLVSRVKVELVAKGFREPWAVEVLPDGRFVVTERGGSLRVVTKDGRILPKIAGVPAVDSYDQAGLLDVAIAPAEGDAFRLCLTYAQPRQERKNRTLAVCGTARGKENLTLSDMHTVFQQEPAWDSSLHFGSRLVFAPNDMLYITTGERSLPATRGFAQDVTKTLGKVVRLKRDGSSPPDNPFAAQGGAAAQVYSYGHRNVQAAALDARSRLWTIEHGPRGGDELNLIRPGVNYGWPIITYGEDYSGLPIGQGITQKEGMEQPVYYWDPVIAPCGMVVYSGKLFTTWQNDILVGGLVAQSLVHLHMQDDRVATEERFYIGARVRDVTEAPDGALYIVTDEIEGRLLRVTPDDNATN